MGVSWAAAKTGKTSYGEGGLGEKSLIHLRIHKIDSLQISTVHLPARVRITEPEVRVGKVR